MKLGQMGAHPDVLLGQLQRCRLGHHDHPGLGDTAIWVPTSGTTPEMDAVDMMEPEPWVFMMGLAGLMPRNTDFSSMSMVMS